MPPAPSFGPSRAELFAALQQGLIGAFDAFSMAQVPPELVERARAAARLYDGSRRPLPEIVGHFLGALAREGLIPKL